MNLKINNKYQLLKGNRNKWTNHCNFGFCHGLLDFYRKHKVTRENLVSYISWKWKLSVLQKIQTGERPGEVLQMMLPVSRSHMEFLKWANLKKRQEWAKELNRPISKEIYKRPISTYQDAYHH